MSNSYVDRLATVKVTLDHIEPAIWRRVEIPLTTTLKGVHEVIQAVMLFEDRHLFDFKSPSTERSGVMGSPILMAGW